MKKFLSLLLLIPALALANGETLSPNMNLIVPAVGITSGPQWAADLVMTLGLVDSHDHTPGKGVQITPAGMNINAPLSCGGNALTNVAGVNLSAQSSTPQNNSVYESGVDLYYVDGNGNNVRLTQGGSIVGTAGSISGLSSPASASYVSANSTFVWQSDSNTSANLDGACLLQRNLSAASNAITLCAPSGLSSNYSLNWFSALPAAQSIVTVDSSGNFAASLAPAALVPPGAIIPYGGSSAPAGYLLCDGTSYLQATYSALYSAIGNAYGEPDGTHFNVPDLRGQFLRGVTGASSNDPNASSRGAMAPSGNTGNNVGSIQPGATAVNGLSGTNTGGESLFPEVVNSSFTTGGSGGKYYLNGTNISTALSPQPTITLSGDSETRPINAYVNYLIKY